MNLARSPAVLTNPVAAAKALVGLSPGITTRRPNGNLPPWPLATGTSSAMGMSGVVSASPAPSMIVCCIQSV
jgi:hypothetical protein